MADEFQEVNVPGHGTFRFPSNMTREQMEPLLKSRVQELTTQSPPQKGGQTLARQPTAPRPSIGGELLSAVTDIPGEAYRTTREQISEVGERAKASHEATESSLKGGSFFGDPRPALRSQWETTKLLGSILGVPFAPAQGAARAVMGHPLAAAEEAAHQGVTAVKGADKAPPTRGYEGIKSEVDMLPISNPRGLGAFAGGTGSLLKAGRDALKPLEKLLSPTTVSPIAGEAEAALRSASGRAARDTATTQAQMEPYHKVVNAMPEIERHSFIEYVENRNIGRTLYDPALQPLADKMRAAYKLREDKLKNLPSTSQMQFIEDYYPHHFEDPTKAAAFAQNFGRGASKQGSGASLKKRTMPTIADGIAAGLKPVTTDPIEATLRYVTSMDRFIASTEVLDAAKAAGTIKYIRPKTMGASGHPDSYKVPDGWVKIEGRGSTDATGAQAFAPADWARVYNNFISKGFHEHDTMGPIYDAVRNTSNMITSLELGLSGYHAFTMGNEAFLSGLSTGIAQLAGGKPIRALGSIASAPFKPISSIRTGKKLEDIYLGRTPGTPDWRKVVNVFTEAGGRAVGTKHAPDYNFSAAGDFWTSFKRGALKLEARQSMANIRAAPISGAVKEGLKTLGKAFQTVSYPLFQRYIPLVKNAAAYDTFTAWLDANPTASHEQQVATMRKIIDSVDNRFGEMIQDNIFWNQYAKQSAILGMRSYSWNLGTVREIAGGAKDLALKPSSLSIKSPDWSPRSNYVLALPIGVAALSAAYQYMKTGKGPESVDDLIAPRTGGIAPGFGGRGEVEERASLPGYQKDVFGWYHDWRQEAKNKRSKMVSMAADLTAGTDWRGDPISAPDADVPTWLSDYFKFVVEGVTPISAKNIMQGTKEGSALGTPAALMGIRPAPAALQDPERTERGMRAIQGKKWKGKERHDRNTKRQYGGPQE